MPVIHHQRRHLRNPDIDLGLAALGDARRRTGSDAPLELQDIADVCSCSTSMISLIEQSALRKLRNALARQGITSSRD